MKKNKPHVRGVGFMLIDSGAFALDGRRALIISKKLNVGDIGSKIALKRKNTSRRCANVRFRQCDFITDSDDTQPARQGGFIYEKVFGAND